MKPIAIKPVILCGGASTRLWPLSTPSHPKPFQAIFSHQSMLYETAARVQGKLTNENIHFETLCVVGALRHHQQIRQQLPEAELILEPVGRDSAPAITVSALCANPEQLLLILPADHYIKDINAFHHALANGVVAAQKGYIVTLGITPTYPASSYGYIETDNNAMQTVCRVSRFVEKPDQKTAKAYLNTGRFLWNAGIFLFRADSMVSALRTCAPKILSAVKRALRPSDTQLCSLDPAAFAAVPKMSIDYAVMEPMSQCDAMRVVPVDMGWSDIGDYAAIHRILCDEKGNATSGPVLCDTTSQNMLVHSNGPLIATVGTNNLAIITKDNAILVSDLSQVQNVRAVAEQVNNFGLGFLLKPKTQEKIHKWLFDSALPLWAQYSWCDEFGGFKENLDCINPEKAQGNSHRMCVQAGQISAFAHAAILGWDGPVDSLISKGLAYINKTYWQKNKGYVHRISKSGVVMDECIRTHDHALALKAHAYACRAGLAPDAQTQISHILDVLDNKLKREDGSYLSDDSGGGHLCATSHMHMLEAFLALYEAFGDHKWLNRATRMVELFEQYFFDPAHDCVLEYFDMDWKPSLVAGHYIEPGHAYIWASLLAKYAHHSGRDLLSWRRRLIASAKLNGHDPRSKLVYTMITAEGKPLSKTYALSPQLAALRALCIEPGATGSVEVEDWIEHIFATYFTGVQSGLWMDSIDRNGQGTTKVVPASTFYHILLTFSVILNEKKDT